MESFSTVRAQIREHGGAWLIRAVAVTGLLVIFFIALGGVSHQERWRIYNIQITGPVIVSRDEVHALVQEKILGNYFFAYARDNSFLFPKQEIEQALLEKFPRLETAVAQRIDAHSISVVVTERKPYALWCGEAFDAESYELVPCWFIDDKGFVFDSAPIISSGVYLETYGTLTTQNGDNPIGGALPAARFQHADKLAQVLKPSIGQPLRIILKPEGEFELVMYSSATYPMLAGVTIKLRDEMVPATILKNLEASLREEFPEGATSKKKLLYIDMRFGNKIFFGFADQSR